MNGKSEFIGQFHPKALTYLVGSDPSFRFSLVPSESDVTANQNLLDHLVSTLVKYGPSGQPEPYLAEKWNVSEDGRLWNFTIRPGVTCQDGSPITAAAYVSNLSRRLRSYSVHSSVLDFDLMEGWGEFLANPINPPSGLYSVDDRVIMKFRRRPEDLLETLRKVYFGYWCESNISQPSPSTSFISSGAFEVSNVLDAGKEIVLRARPGWFSLAEGSPNEIRFVGSSESKPVENCPCVVALGLNPPPAAPEGYKLLRSPPSWLVAIVLGGKGSQHFSDKNNRQAFRRRIQKFLESNPFPKGILTPGRTFFPFSSEGVSPEPALSGASNFATPDSQLHFVYSRSLPQPETDFINRLLSFASGANPAIAVLDRSQKNWMEEFLSGEKLDGRIQMVDTGGHMVNSAIKMMFCTRLGVRFPDSSGQICKLVKETEEKEAEVDVEYRVQFNRALYTESEVIPIAHTGSFFLYSDLIDPQSISPYLITPRFDLLKFQ